MYDDIVASRVEGNISGRDRDFAYALLNSTNNYKLKKSTLQLPFTINIVSFTV